MALTRQQCEQALAAAGGNKTHAATALGVPRSTFIDTLRRMGVSAAVHRPEKEELNPVEEHRLRSQVRHLQQQVRDLSMQNHIDDELARLIRSTAATDINPPRWLAPKRHAGDDKAIATAFLSDLHLDEVVHAEQINYVNAYNREIATARLQRFFRNVIRLCRDYVAGMDIEGLVLAMGGDMVSGNIHEELKETNAAPMHDTLLYWSEQIAAGIHQLLSAMDVPIYIPCVVGNHGRTSRKPKAKFRAQENYDWLLYHIIAREFRSEKRVTFNIADGADLKYTLYGTRYQLTHGDQFRGGSGIAGLLSPLMLGDHRKRKRETAVGQPYDYLVMGHWHQLAHFKGLIVNGSMKGYDEYAQISNFDFEPPQQAFWLTDSRRGKTIDAPIHVLGDDEPWRAHEPHVIGGAG